MSPGTPVKTRRIVIDDPVLHPGWALLEYLMSIGGDEFAVRFIGYGDDAGDQLMAKLNFASLGDRIRECTVAYAKESNPRAIEVWRLDKQSLQALRDVMPSGIMCRYEVRPTWAEDLCVYRDGAMLFGTVTHEGDAFLRLSDAEWIQWEAHAAVIRRAK